MGDTKKQGSSILVILCALGLLAFLLTVIYPNYRTMKDYDRQISELNSEIVLRQTLAPIYGQLIERARMVPPTQLIAPEKTALDIGNTNRLTQIFNNIAEDIGLRLESVTPDALTFDEGDGRLIVEVIYRGEFLNVQPLINTIVGQSFVERIHQIHVYCTEENKRITLSVSLLHR